MKDENGDLSYLVSMNSTQRLTDHLGSVVAITDEEGDLISQQRYLPFGGVRTNIASGPIVQTDYGYTGQRNLDEDIGLMDYKARFYSPVLNRFIKPDSIVPNPANPQAFNRYSYVVNSPINLNDPTGHAYCDFINSQNKEDCEGGLANSQSSSVIWKKKDKEETNKEECKTVACKAFSGDLDSLIELVTPSHVGWRIQLEGTWWIISGSVGGNVVYNFNDAQFGSSVDWAIGLGPGVGQGAAVTTGPLVGFLSTDVADVVTGNSAIISGSAAAGPAGTVAIVAPFSASDGFHVDPYYGQTPFTLYLGGGAGGGFADAGFSYGGVFTSDTWR